MIAKKCKWNLKQAPCSLLCGRTLMVKAMGNWAWVFEAACKLVQSEFHFALPERVLQV
jgi:hypothetical protein